MTAVRPLVPSVRTGIFIANIVFIYVDTDALRGPPYACYKLVARLRGGIVARPRVGCDFATARREVQ